MSPGESSSFRARRICQLHLITAIRGEQYRISSNRGRVNGWITRNGIHGVLTGKE